MAAVRRNIRVILPVVALLVLIATGYFLLSGSLIGSARAQGEVDIQLLPAQQTVAEGDSFTLTVQVNASADAQVDTVQVYLDFDPTKLVVVALADGTTLPVQLQSTFDNTKGQINYAAGTFGDPAAAPFTLVTVTLEAIVPLVGGVMEDTDVMFAPLVAPRETKAVLAGENFTGNLSPATVSIEGVNQAPVAVDDAVSTLEEAPVTIDVLANDSDPDGDALSVGSLTQPLSGTVIINPDQTVTYTPDVNFVGSDSFTYTASDGVLDSNVATVSITVSDVPEPPVAVDDAFSVVENSTLIVDAPGVLFNDLNESRDPLVALLVDNVSNGTLDLSSDGSFSYTPAADFIGTDIFTYQASNGPQISNVATVTITVTQEDVDIELVPAQQTVVAGEEFTLAVQVNAGLEVPVDTVQVYLDFDPTKLAAVALVDGTTLPVQLQSEFDNTLGRVNYAAGTFGDPVAAPFTLVTVTFEALAPAPDPGTAIVFAPLNAPRETKAISEGANVTGTLSPANVVVQENVGDVELRVSLQIDTPDGNDSFLVEFFQNGVAALPAIRLDDVPANLGAPLDYTLILNDIPAGVYDLVVRTDRGPEGSGFSDTLPNAALGVEVSKDSIFTKDMGTLLEGDAIRNEDEIINALDLSFLLGFLTPGLYDAGADLNQNGLVEGEDLALLTDNYLCRSDGTGEPVCPSS